MKQFAIIAAAVLIGMLGALLLYDLLVLKPRGAALAETLTKTAEADLANARSEAQAVAENFDAAVDRSVDDAKQAMAGEASELDGRRLANEALNRATTFKLAISEHYMTMGTWPTNADEVGLAPAASYAGGAVAGIEVGAQGVVTIALTDALAADGRILLTPTADPQSYVIQWKCTTEGSNDLRRYLPACR